MIGSVGIRGPFWALTSQPVRRRLHLWISLSMGKIIACWSNEMRSRKPQPSHSIVPVSVFVFSVALITIIYTFLFFSPPHTRVSTTQSRCFILFCSPLFPQPLTHSMAHGRFPVNICWLDEWMDAKWFIFNKCPIMVDITNFTIVIKNSASGIWKECNWGRRKSAPWQRV